MKPTRMIALILMTVLFCACIGCEKIDLSGDHGGETKPPQSVSDPNTLTVKTTISGNETFRPEDGASTKTDRILQQIVDTEAKTGYTVDVEIVSEELLSTAFLRACRAGVKYADVIQTDAQFLFQQHQAGFLVSLEQAGIAPSSTGVLTRNGEAFAFRADGWNNPLPTVSYLLYYNEALFSEGGCETPLELYEAGYWNWTNFETLASRITRAYPGEVFALATPTVENSDLIWATLYASGAVYFDASGACVMDSQEALDGFARLKQLKSANVTYNLGSVINHTADPTEQLAFINRRTAMLVGNASLLFATEEDSISENLGEHLRIIGFPEIKKGVSTACFTREDPFCAITSRANLSLCEELIPLLFAEPEGANATEDMIRDYFFYEEDAAIYFDLLSKAGTETSMGMGDHRSTVDEFFVRVFQGASAKEILSNLEIIFNSQQKG